MRISQTTRRFRKDYSKLKKSGRRDMKKLHRIMEKLIDGEALDVIHRDHAFRDCHVEGDWVLIYQLSKNKQGEEIVTFCATDNHSHLFD